MKNRSKTQEDQMSIRFTTIFVIALAFLIGISGCRGGNISFQDETALEKNWGRSYELMKYNQIANPDAGKTVEPATDLDGIAADKAVEKYRDSFTSGKKQETVNILKLQ
jgi:hypothetical protein